MKKQLTGIILAGGKSRRMGSDKGLLHWKGKTFTEHIAEGMKDLCDQVTVISNQPGYEYFGLNVIHDIIPDKGPAGGIYTGLFHSASKFNLVVSCDMPMVNADLYKYLISHLRPQTRAIIPAHHGTLYPLCGIYATDTREVFESCIKNDELRMLDIIIEMRAQVVEVGPEQNFWFPDLFLNVNTPEDYEKIKKLSVQ